MSNITCYYNTTCGDIVQVVAYFYKKSGGTQSYRALVMFSDHSATMLQHSGMSPLLLPDSGIGC